MPVNPLTYLFERVANSFSNPVNLTVVQAPDANSLFNDYDDAINFILSFQITNTAPVTSGNITVADDQGSSVIKKVAPVTTGVVLPSIADRDGRPYRLWDISTGIVAPSEHTITFTPDGSDTIMGAGTWDIINYGAGAGILLIPYADESTWLVAD